MWILAFGKIWDTFSYFGTQTILALYFMHIFHLPRSTSYTLYGSYAAIAFLTPMLGGVLADRWLGSKRSVVSGLLLSITGNLLLVSLNRYLFCLGLSASLVGSGIYKSNSTSAVGDLYPKGDKQKEAGFTFFYLAMNVGGMLGPLVYGLAARYIGWNYAFLFSAISLFISGCWLLNNWDKVQLRTKPVEISSLTSVLVYISMVIVCILLSLTLYFPIITNEVICSLFIISLGYLFFSIKKYSGRERRHLLALLLFCFLGMFYFVAGLQTGTTITLFLQHKIQQGAINLVLPSSTFNLLYCLFVLLLTPVFAYLWHRLRQRGIELSAPAKLAMGIGFATLGIFTFSLAALTNAIISNVLIGYMLLSAGELVLTPAAYTSISDLAPVGMKSTMVGCWLLFIAMGSYFSSVLANGAHMIAAKLFSTSSADVGVFLLIAIFMLMMTLIATSLAPRLSRVMSS